MGEKYLPTGVDYTSRGLKIPKTDPGYVTSEDLDALAAQVHGTPISTEPNGSCRATAQVDAITKAAGADEQTRQRALMALGSPYGGLDAADRIIYNATQGNQ